MTEEWTPARLLPYQKRAIQHLLEHPNAMLWEGVGLGKTVQVLTTIVDLQDRLQVGGVLIIGPLRIIQTVWMQEAAKWSHTRHLRFSLIHGSAQRRSAMLRRQADIYLINYENLVWLATQVEHLYLRHKRYPPFSMVVYDEVTKVKNAQSKRMVSWKKVLPYFSRRVGMTGEPAANGYADLHGQFLAVDGGKRLGTSITAYRDAFLKPFGFGGHQYVVTKTGKDAIHRRVQDITLELSAEDYLDLPPVVNNVLWVDLPPKVRDLYDLMEKEFFVMLDSGAEIEAPSAAALLTKLAQIASGAAYLSPGGPWERIHDEKLNVVEDLLEESSGRPLLMGYSYVHEATRLAERFPERRERHEGAAFLSSRLSGAEIEDVIRRWKADEIPLLCAHPQSAGHGLNLQGGSARDVVWFSLPWSLELYNQMNGRLIGGHRRQGASVIHHIIARDTVDEMIFAALQTKHATQESLKLAIKTYREKRNG